MTEPIPMDDDGGQLWHQVELECERMTMDTKRAGRWVCTYCGADARTDPDPRASACCGEVGHIEWSEDDEN